MPRVLAAFHCIVDSAISVEGIVMQADLVRSLDARLSVLLTDAEEADAGERLRMTQSWHITMCTSHSVSLTCSWTSRAPGT